ncbi:hypothetical protein F441_15838 [Phytophthora nicotianae CJ01A1]|uniref:Uncharacterized protein n=4 Tax=Phytophthora nicotianae TaxID=4792 RepID=W2YN96_PHYNI|nr:hypothetical protein L915_15549 [Phytophthora nicotianae]ETL85066.1 hypothetical protein L917_15268 [Phytophthora nicotianae]ETO66967.1 hypothetical protein F444_15983 [Phytophthora nicotianae P1976]ETP08066.1 hypothetical protein F441_15838 [Phytophthora nicotianae CJ01A1]ETP36118.1 hypothetical protein F442_15848 [Phytophthora nicotianae P10297]
MSSGDSKSLDDENDEIRLTPPPAQGTSRSAHAEPVPSFFDSSFTPAVLAFLSEIEDRELTPEQLQALEQIMDKTINEAKILLCCSNISNTKKLQQEGGGRLGDALVDAFQLAATHLNQTEKLSSDITTHQLLWRCGQVVDVLWGIGVEEKELRDQHLLWQELLCRRWNEIASGLALELLLLQAQLKYTRASSTTFSEILEVVASTYAYLPVTLQKYCMDQVATLVSTFVDEGPTFRLTPRMQLQLELLEHLTTVHALNDSDDLDTVKWVNEYFPECFECCGVVLQLLNKQYDGEKGENDSGMIRMLDTCLLVIKAAVDFFETRRDDVCALQRILIPTITEALSQLACRYASFGVASEEISEARCLETCLYLLARTATVLEEDECPALIKIFEKLFAPNSKSDFSTARPTLLPTRFDAVHQILVHSSVAGIFEPAMSALLQVDVLNVPQYAQYLFTPAYCSTENSQVERTARYCNCTRFDRSQQDDTATDDSESAASLFSDGNSVGELVSDQENVSV